MTQAWDLVHIPLAAGMQQKADPRAIEPPDLTVCKNAQFDEVGGIQKRKPYSDLAGSAPADIRRLRVIDGELVAFTDDEVYSYSEANQAWTKVDDYWAVKTRETIVFDGTSDQIACQRAELGGVIVYAWMPAASGSSGTGTYLAALNKSTGSVIAGPTLLSTINNPQLIALKDRILFAGNLNTGTNSVVMKMLLPSNLDSSTAGEGFSGANQVTYTTTATVDGPVLAKMPEQADKAVFVITDMPTTNEYRLGIVTGGSSGNPSVSYTDTTNNADYATVAAAPDGRIIVVRQNAGSLVADVWTAAIAEDSMGNALMSGVAPDYMAMAFSSTVSGGEYTAHVFASVNETETDTTTFIQHNTIDTAGSAGTEAKLLVNQGLASGAFDYDGNVYFWSVFADENIAQNSMSVSSTFTSQVQNTYALNRYDGELVAVASQRTAGGFGVGGWSPSHVQQISDTEFAVCLGQQRRVTKKRYTQKSPLDVVFSFDSDKARRTAQAGRTGYIAGGHVCQYDGKGVVEVGFHLFPWSLDGSMAGSGGALSAGDYTYKCTYRWLNAKGEQERSTTATYGTITAAASDKATIDSGCSSMTRKKSPLDDPALEFWRSEVNPAVGADFYLVSSIDPWDSTNPNRYVENDPTAQTCASFDDDDSDATIRVFEANPENGGVLESVSPPAASIIYATQDRVFLAGLASDPYTVAYSLLRGDGEIASFNEGLAVSVPRDSGEITALSWLNETMVVFCEHGIYMLPGDGFDNLGSGQNYGPPRLISIDVGADCAEGVAVTPDGVFFRSLKGWYLLDRGWGVNYIGAAVSDYDSDTLVGVEVLAKQHQVRVVSTSRILVYDTLVKQWSEWEESGVVGSCIWQGKHLIATSDDKIKEQRTDHDGCNYSLDVETAWVKLSGLQGFSRARSIAILGEYRSAHQLRIRAARDFDEVDSVASWFDDKLWTPSPATAGGPLQVKHRLSRQKCQAIKFRITDRDSAASTLPAPGEALRLTGISLEYGTEKGLRRLPAAQKQ